MNKNGPRLDMWDYLSLKAKPVKKVIILKFTTLHT